MDKQTGVEVQLTGEDGNAFAVMAKAAAAMRKAGVDKKIIDDYYQEATSGDYDNLLRTTMKYVEVI